jgi:hypothetical protein
MGKAHRTWEDFLLAADDLIERADNLDGRGADFGESVAVQVAKMRQTVELREDVTDRQWEALSNMATGVARWEPG